VTIEDRLREALHQADRIVPHADLFERLTLSLEEERARRRRFLTTSGAILLGLLVLSGYLAWVFGSSEGAVAGWKVVLPQLVISLALIVTLGPNIRRFGVAYVDDVFHLTPETGRRFLAALDIAYYLTVVGWTLVDADVWQLGVEGPVGQVFEEAAGRVATLLLVMGVLHAFNIASLPVLGLVYNSVARAQLRSSGDAPPELLSARKVDRNARAFAIGIVVAVLALLASVLIGPLAGWVGGLGPGS
jgi:hypothetical protein